MNKLSLRIMSDLSQALKDFGTYTFWDKGPHEVMAINELAEEVQALPPKEAAEVLIEVAQQKKHKGAGLQVAGAIVLELQEWDELFEIPGIDDILNGDLPGQPRTSTPVAISVVRPDDFLKELLNK